MSLLHDQELADVLEAERLKRVKRVRAACTTVPSISADEVAARIVHTIESLSPGGRPRRPAVSPESRIGTPSRAGDSTNPVATNGTSPVASRATHAPGASPASPGPLSEERATDLTHTGAARKSRRGTSASGPRKAA